MANNREAYEDTSVPWHTSRGQVEQMIRDEAGATNIMWAEVTDHPLAPEGGSLVLLRWIGPLPLAEGRAVKVGVRIGVPIPATGSEKERRQRTNQRHRALYWWLRGKFNAVKSGIITFPEEFLPHIEVGAGTVFEQVGPQVAQGLLDGNIKPLALLPGM